MTIQLEAAQAAKTWLGTPYRHQASLIGVGCDCLGLVRGVWRTLYGDEPDPMPPYHRSPRDREGAAALLTAAERYFVRASNELQPGDLLLFRLMPKLAPRHCGIMLDTNRFVHAQERLGVIEMPFDGNWQRKLHSIYHFPERT